MPKNGTAVRGFGKQTEGRELDVFSRHCRSVCLDKVCKIWELLSRVTTVPVEIWVWIVTNKKVEPEAGWDIADSCRVRWRDKVNLPLRLRTHFSVGLVWGKDLHQTLRPPLISQDWKVSSSRAQNITISWFVHVQLPFSPELPDRFWFPPNLLFTGYRLFL
jgi:hypothetical protein